MARIAGVELSDQGRIDWALTRIKGIGWTSSVKVLKKAGISAEKRVGKLTTDEISQITSALEDYLTEGDLIRNVRENIQRLKDTGAYRGVRHSRGLPVRGQRTKSNARTKRGKRKTVGAFRKDDIAKAGSGAAGTS